MTTTTHSLAETSAAETIGSRLIWAARDCWTIVLQEFTHLIRQPSTFAWQIGFPVVMVLMFVYVFGSAMDVTGEGAGEGYVDFAMPGMFAMTMALGFMDTAYAVTHNKEKGFMDRFRSMPMSPSAPVTGRAVSDVIRAALDLVIIAGVALLIGWRSGGSLGATLLAFVLLLWLRLALILVGIYLGLCITNTETAGMLFAVAFPLGFISSVFTPPEMMPGWLGAIAAWNPVSSTATAIRELFQTPGIDYLDPAYWIDGHALPAAFIWPVVIMLIFGPLAVRQFKALSR
ncbi:ABC transporter permease [Rhodococcus sp. HNM0563]|uniref:ABC transporter permease n=1 Tax=unclassified Rhodococcus (in: high G+C Gram-positive bacteria) TaxID=192944 RepID=UPI00146EAE72|nr:MULTISPECIES: ABC transporter permease [unclassified Rhodococcus (in: high G+C Gram-positive bacteria)]MCK0090845.1 ABC transporter permease [Rhodococcus sp. F64268]NLU61113.1 ABC transporter permease [Rhodococcus sp. HNM0563]